jgi:DNA-binding transcriptional LysR family regulator
MPTSSINLSAIDLNLLVIFDALMQERHVTKTARRLSLSQPAVSHALARLRHMLRDELLVRSPKGMLPTPRAEQLAGPVRRAVDELQRALEPESFDPAKAARTFRIAVDNYSAIVIAAQLAAQVTTLAPNIVLDFRASGTLDISDLLDQGQLDLALGPPMPSEERFASRELLQGRFVTLMRKDHSAAAARKLSPEVFAALPHLEISSSRHPTNFIDAALKRTKRRRRIVLRAPFLSAGSILAASDAVAVLPHRIAHELACAYPLVWRELPFPSPTMKTAMMWPRWLDSVPAHRWLRQLVEGTAKELAH